MRAITLLCCAVMSLNACAADKKLYRVVKPPFFDKVGPRAPGTPESDREISIVDCDDQQIKGPFTKANGFDWSHHDRECDRQKLLGQSALKETFRNQLPSGSDWLVMQDRKSDDVTLIFGLKGGDADKIRSFVQPSLGPDAWPTLNGFSVSNIVMKYSARGTDSKITFSGLQNGGQYTNISFQPTTALVKASDILK